MKCRVCKSKNLKYALKLKGYHFIICRACTALQRQQDIPYNIELNFQGKFFEFDYYPAFLARKEYDCVNENSCIFFSLKAMEFLLEISGYKVLDAEIVGNKLHVSFDAMTKLEKLRTNEQILRLDNQFTYFLWSVRK